MNEFLRAILMGMLGRPEQNRKGSTSAIARQRPVAATPSPPSPFADQETAYVWPDGRSVTLSEVLNDKIPMEVRRTWINVMPFGQLTHSKAEDLPLPSYLSDENFRRLAGKI